MIRILDRMVLGTFLKLFVGALLMAPVLFILGDITENSDTFVDRGLGWGEIALSYVYQLPLFFQWSFPIAALVAAVFTIHGMTTHREVVAAKAGGVSFHRLVLPVLVAGALLTGLALAFTDVVPLGQRRATELQHDEDPRRSWRSDFVYLSESGMTWQVGRLTASDGRMSDLVLERPPEDGRAALHVMADAAEWDSVQGWKFARGYVRTMRPDSTAWTYQYERLKLAGLDERPDELLELPREAEEMTYAEIERQARIIERGGGDALELRVKRQGKLAIPVATLVVILLGIPLATSNQRGGTAFGVGISLGITIAYLVLFKITGALGEAGALSPPVAAWLPNVLFLGAAVVMMGRVRT